MQFQNEIEIAAKRHGLDPRLVRAVCMVESSGDTFAYRYEPAFWQRYMKNKPEYAGQEPERVSASYGLMQIMYPVARELGYRGHPELLWQPARGLDYGCRKLKQTLSWARGDVAAALAAYNGGMTKDNAAGVTPKRNQRYVDKVTAALAVTPLQ